jgi:hypothetical protein
MKRIGEIKMKRNTKIILVGAVAFCLICSACESGTKSTESSVADSRDYIGGRKHRSYRKSSRDNHLDGKAHRNNYNNHNNDYYNHNYHNNNPKAYGNNNHNGKSSHRFEGIFKCTCGGKIVQ